MQSLQQQSSLTSCKALQQRNSLPSYPSSLNFDAAVTLPQRGWLNRSSAIAPQQPTFLSKSLVNSGTLRSKAAGGTNALALNHTSTLSTGFARSTQAARTTTQVPAPTRNAAPAEWTFMVYMAGDDLEWHGINDFIEMSRIGSNGRINVVVQFDRTHGYDNSFGNWTDTRRGLVRPGQNPGLNWGTSIGEVNMGSEDVLQDFATWGMSNFQAKNYALILWGHGDGIQTAEDDLVKRNGDADGITAKELNSVLGRLPDTVDLVGADSCFMGMTEFAYKIRDRASVFVGSQDVVPGEGWNYTPVLRDLRNRPTMDAAQLGRTIVTHFGQYYRGVENNIIETKSVINLSALRESSPNSLTTALNNFAWTVTNSPRARSDRFLLDRSRDSISRTFGGRWNARNDDYIDVGNLFNRIVRDRNVSPAVRQAASGVLTAYRGAIISNYSYIKGRSTGLSIYFSDRGVRPRREFSRTNFDFSTSHWWNMLASNA